MPNLQIPTRTKRDNRTNWILPLCLWDSKERETPPALSFVDSGPTQMRAERVVRVEVLRDDVVAKPLPAPLCLCLSVSVCPQSSSTRANLFANLVYVLFIIY